MKECYKCGELKEVRKIERYSIFDSFYEDYICEDCNKASEIEIELNIKKRLKIKKKEQKVWIKQRDKILKKNE